MKALRAIFDAHRSWLSYSYGTSQSDRNLNSSLLRLDFGPEDMRPEGVVGENDTKTWRVGKLRQYILDLVVERFKLAYEIQRYYGCNNCIRDHNGCESCRKVAKVKFQKQAKIPTAAEGPIPFWEDGKKTPNMLQLTQIQPWESLGTHWDSRNKWLEGILSIGFGDIAGKDDARGDKWNILLEKGTPAYNNYIKTTIECKPTVARP